MEIISQLSLKLGRLKRGRGSTVKKPYKGISGTTWVAHTEQAVEAVIHNWPVLVEHLMQVKITDKGDRGRKVAGLYNTLIILHVQYLYSLSYFFIF